MIVFDLSCNCGFQFEGWFRDRGDFEYQSQKGGLVCPSCAGNQIKKILSPVAFKKKPSQNIDFEPKEEVAAEKPAADLLKSVQEHVLKNYEDVGAKFAKEALKIHYGLGEPRNIRGTGTEEEEKMLKKEGIELLKIPLPAKSDKN